jgi:hypothetical protein
LIIPIKRNAKPLINNDLALCGSDRTRTYDLWVMSPTSYQLLHAAISCRKGNAVIGES